MSGGRSYAALLERGQRAHGDKFDASDLDPRFRPYYESGRRIRVETCGLTLTGWVGASTGWRPCFLLMRTRRSLGSPWTLGKDEVLTGEKIGRRYYHA